MRRALIPMIVLVSCAGVPPAPPRHVGSDAAACAARQEPLSISLRATKGPGLEAVLSTCSDAQQVVLHDSHLQACRLVLVDASGAEVESFDTRMIMKFDNTPYQSLFSTLAPDDGLVLHEERFLERDDGGWELDWGPYRFAEIDPGTYTARVEWTSTRDTWYDEETGRQETVEGIWTGTIRSNEVTITLP